MYRKRHGRISPRGVVEFLLLDREFPRAVHFCLLAARDSLHAISGTPPAAFRHPPGLQSPRSSPGWPGST